MRFENKTVSRMEMCCCCFEAVCMNMADLPMHYET